MQDVAVQTASPPVSMGALVLKASAVAQQDWLEEHVLQVSYQWNSWLFSFFGYAIFHCLFICLFISLLIFIFIHAFIYSLESDKDPGHTLISRKTRKKYFL